MRVTTPEIEYLCFETGRDPQILAERIRTLVQNHRLGESVFRFCTQKGAHLEKRYWAFLALAPGAPLPPIIADYLKDQKIRLQPQRLKEKQVQRMLANRQISLERPDPIVPYVKPQRTFEGSIGPEESFCTVKTDNTGYNSLLYWLSASGSGSWKSFSQVCQQLNLATTSGQVRIILRHLYLLGHLETSPDGSEWSVAPEAWVKVQGADEWFHAGMRAGQTPAGIKAQVQANGPDRWVSAKAPKVRLRAGDVSQTLSHQLGSLQAWKQSLAEKPMAKLVHYQFERWNGAKFEPLEIPPTTSGLYRVRPYSQRLTAHYTLYFDAERQVWLQGEWSGLRFLSDAEHGDDIPWHYLKRQKQLILRLDQRPPRLYERALVLASGRLPRLHQDWLHYPAISEDLARSLSQHLGSTLLKEPVHV